MSPPPLRRRDCLAALAGLALPAALQAAPVLRLPPLALRERRLANGLHAIGIPMQGTSTVSVQVWYRVGGRDDPPGRSGFAHLFEHMMFKGTSNTGAETFDRLTEDVGGHNNAFTAEDVTAYQSVVPSNHLERLLWAESDRMARLKVDQANFDSERAVVLEEFRERVLASPYGRLFNALAPNGFERHPYRRPVIGSVDELNAATLDDVRAFHAAFYRPDNATLIVAGDFDPAAFDAWVERHFGPLPRPAGPVPRVPADEPRRSEPRRVALHGPNVPLPAVALLWQGPPAAHADAAALQVASALLSSGESARLNESMVYRAQVAQAAGFGADLHAEAGLLTAYAIAAAGQAPVRLEQDLLREIRRLAEGPIDDTELDKVRIRLTTSTLARRQRPDGRADAVGWAALLRGDPRQADREFAEMQAVRAADVRRVLRRHVLKGVPVTISYTQEGS